ncbi:unnamed protein product [Angiostrongylus costaricensis]|uniref:Peptidase A1 domain-containing protein n=1 Tax=Angiostrongylus costaricensis TaxID=334426 RepID=A0A158PFD7_ANGCS|nr:unnamed protein product [Angiostrongylus costaricensis]
MKTILVLATLAAIAHGKTYTMETRSSGSLISRLMKEKRYQKYLEERNLHRSQVLVKGSQPVEDVFDTYYLVNITVGTPGQNFSLLLDTGSSSLWVIDISCNTKACYSLSPERRRFNSSTSSTFSTQNRTLFIGYDFGSCNGRIATDTVSFAGICKFLDAESLSDDFTYMPYDGILGLGWPAVSVGNITPPMQNLLPALDAPLFTVWLERQINVSYGGAGGLVTFGAVDTTNCELDVNYVPLTSEAYGQFPLSGFSIGRFSKKFTQDAVSDTGSSWIGVPPYLINTVAGYTGGQYDTGYQFYTVNCSTMMTQPDVEFTINDVKYSLKSEDYVIDLGLGGGQVSASTSTQQFSGPIDWTALVLYVVRLILQICTL